MIEIAYIAGIKLRKKIIEKKGDINTVVLKIQNAKTKHDFADCYLNLCLAYKLEANNDFVIDILTEKTTVGEVSTSLCLGLTSEKDYFFSLNDILSLKEASEIWGLDDSTLRHAIASDRFKDDEYRKTGRNYIIKKEAMERVYGKSLDK